VTVAEASKHTVEAGLLQSHYQWCEVHRQEWSNLRLAYADKFWGARRTNANATRPNLSVQAGMPGGQVSARAGRMRLVQSNLIRPYAASFVASLFYRGVKFDVTRDQIVTSDETTKTDGPEFAAESKTPAAIAALLDRWFASQEFTDLAEQAFIQGLIFAGGGAFKIGIDPQEPGRLPLDRVWADTIPPWEAVWDRATRSKHDLRYTGHVYQLPIEDALELGWCEKDTEKSRLLDIVETGWGERIANPDGPMVADDSYVTIFELHDLKCSVKAKGKDEDGKEVDVDVRGETRIYLVKGYAMGGVATPELELVDRAPLLLERHDGRPDAPVLPIILEPVPGQPLDSLASAQSVYDLNAELNRAASVLATAYERDAARIILYLKNAGVDEKVIESILNAEDVFFQPVDAQHMEGLFKHLDLPPISDTLLKYREHLLDALDRTQMLAEFTRGKSSEYRKAAETEALVTYTESTIGRIKKRMDACLASLGSKYLRAVLQVTESSEVKSYRVRVDDKEVDLPVSALDRRWQLQVVDAASSPGARQGQLTEFVALVPTLLELAKSGGKGAGMATEILRHLVKLADLPKGMDPSVLQADPAPEPPAPSPGAAPPPGDAVGPGPGILGAQPGQGPA
jgi:hypothetical protein